MIYLLHGDSYRVRAALREIRGKLDDPDQMLESNTTLLDGRAVTPEELVAHAMAVPFLAPARLVIVEGLLGALGAVKRGRGKKPAADDPLEVWQRTAARLGEPGALPETTTLVFVEGPLDNKNIAFPIFAPIARTMELARPKGTGELAEWLHATAEAKGVNLSGRALATLSQFTDADLWALDREIEKLGAYAGGDVVEAEMVSEAGSLARETKIWDLADAVVAGDERKALLALQRLLIDEPAPLLSFMITRQYRQIAIVKDMRERRARQDEVARAAGVPHFRVNAVGTLAARYSWQQIRAAYRRMLEADLNVKRGLQDDESSLQLLVHDLCSIASEPSARPLRA